MEMFGFVVFFVFIFKQNQNSLPLNQIFSSLFKKETFMKKIGLTVILFSLVFSTIFAQTYSEIIAKADAAYKEKDYETSWKTYKEAFKMNSEGRDLYNAACSAALAG